MGLVKCCREQVVAVSPDTPAVEVARVMGEKNVGSVVIVTGDNRPVGVLTDRDLTSGSWHRRGIPVRYGQGIS